MNKRRDGPMAALYREAINVCACLFCERTGNMVLETHHVVPISKGGVERDFNNFICLCHRCHRGNELHSRFKERMSDVLFWKAFSELLILKTTAADCDEKEFRRVLIDSAREMREPGGYEYRIGRLYETEARIPDTYNVLTFDEMLEIDDGRTDARIDDMHQRVHKEEKIARRQEIQDIKNTPIFLMRTKG